MKVYVVTAPESARKIFDTWAECEKVVKGVPGARFQAVANRKTAEVMLAGGITLPSGLHAFTDGNAAGGVGLLLVHGGRDVRVAEREISMNVKQVFVDTAFPGLDSEVAVVAALGKLHNVLAELAALYLALVAVPAGAELTVVHDYEGVGAWMQGRWKTKDRIVAMIIDHCQRVTEIRQLRVAYRHQRGHQSSWAGRDDFVHWNGRADKLATQGPNRDRPASVRPAVPWPI